MEQEEENKVMEVEEQEEKANFQQQQQEQQQEEEQQAMEALEEMQAQQQDLAQDQPQQQHQHPSLSKPKKPLTPYMLFIQRQKQQTIAGQKFNLRLASQVWKTLTSAQKAQYHNLYTVQKEAYDDYIKKCAQQGINFEGEEELDFVFPISRVRAIMRQDPTIAAKGETVIAMNKALEFFGEHVLNAVAKTLGGKKKVEAADLWEAINSDRMLWFLRPLIDQKDSDKNPQPKSSQKPKQTPNHINLQLQPQPQQPAANRPKPTTQKNLRTKQPSASYQMKLTDMFKR